METWKNAIGENALKKGIINDPSWLEKLDDSMPVWAVLQLMIDLMEKLEPQYTSFD